MLYPLENRVAGLGGLAKDFLIKPLGFSETPRVCQGFLLLGSTENDSDKGRRQRHQHTYHDKGGRRPLNPVPEAACGPQEKPHCQRNAAQHARRVGEGRGHQGWQIHLHDQMVEQCQREAAPQKGVSDADEQPDQG